MESYYSKLILIIGYNGTGKSTMVNRFMTNYIKKKGRVLIVVPDDEEWQEIPEIDIKDKKKLSSFKGIRKVIFEDAKEQLKDLYNYTHGMLVFDDMMAYFEANTLKPVHKFMIRRRQRKITVLGVAHGFTEVPPKMFTFCKEMVLFYTQDNPIKRKNEIRDINMVLKAQARINKKAENNMHYFEVLKFK